MLPGDTVGGRGGDVDVGQAQTQRWPWEGTRQRDQGSSTEERKQNTARFPSRRRYTPARGRYSSTEFHSRIRGSSSRSAFSIRRPCIDAAWILPSQQSFLVDYCAESSKPFNIPHRRFSASGYSGSCGYRDYTETTICLYFNQPLSTTTSTEQRHTVLEGCLYPSQRPGRAAGGKLTHP